MITLISDLHGCLWKLHQICENVPKSDTIIQMGDFGIWPDAIDTDNPTMGLRYIPRKVYFIDGNHEHFSYIPLDAEGPTEIFNNLFYIPRGSYLKLDGRNILFLGGADSPDKKFRVEGKSWFREETITSRHINRALDHKGKPLDMMITHTPPFEVVQEIFGSDTPPEWNYSAKAVQGVWEEFGKPPLFCGHLHMTKRVGNVVILDEMKHVRI